MTHLFWTSQKGMWVAYFGTERVFFRMQIDALRVNVGAYASTRSDSYL